MLLFYKIIIRLGGYAMIKSKLNKLISILCCVFLAANFTAHPALCTAGQSETSVSSEQKLDQKPTESPEEEKSTEDFLLHTNAGEDDQSENIKIDLKYIANDELNQATYDTAFKTDWGSIYYSTDGGSTYKELNEGTTVSEGVYTFDSEIESVMLKAIWSDKKTVTIGDTILENGIATEIEKGTHTMIFQEAVYTIAWICEGDISADKLIKNGKVSIDPSDDVRGIEDETGGVYVAKPGAEVTIHLTPDYGYQFIGKDFEGAHLEAAEEKCTYTFTMPEENIVLSDLFTQKNDEANINSPFFSGGEILNTSNVIKSGNLQMDINTAVITQETKSKINSVIEKDGLHMMEYFDIELSNFFLKGGTIDKWEEPLNSLDTPAKIKLSLSNSIVGAEDCKIIRIHDGETSVLDTTYDKSSNSLTFETDKFSSYALATKSTPQSSVPLISNIKTGDNNKLLLYSLLMITSIVGYTATFRFKKKQEIWF